MLLNDASNIEIVCGTHGVGGNMMLFSQSRIRTLPEIGHIMGSEKQRGFDRSGIMAGKRKRPELFFQRAGDGSQEERLEGIPF